MNDDIMLIFVIVGLLGVLAVLVGLLVRIWLLVRVMRVRSADHAKAAAQRAGVEPTKPW